MIEQITIAWLFVISWMTVAVAQTFPGSAIPNTRVANYSVAATDCGKTIQLGTGATGQFTLTLPSPTGFPAACLIAVKNGDTVRGKTLAGFPADVNAILYPQQSVVVQINNAAWVSSFAPGRWRLGADTGIFVDSANGNDANDGLAAGAGGALRTFAAATAMLFDKIDGNNAAVTVNLAAGQTWTGLVYNGAPIDTRGVLIDAHGGTITSSTGAGLTIITNSALSGGGITFGLVLQNATITCSGGANGIDLEGGTFSAGVGMVYGACPGGRHILGNNQARMFFIASYSITGPAAYHIYGHAGFVFNYVDPSVVVTITGTPAWGTAWVGLVENSMVLMDGVTFVGASTGTRFTVGFNSSIVGVVNTNQNACANLPGSTPGLMVVNSSCQGLGSPTASCTGSIANPTVTGSDQQWTLTEGTGSIGCIVSFKSFSIGSACVFSSSDATVQASLFVSSLNSGGVNYAHTATNGAIIYGSCPMLN